MFNLNNRSKNTKTNKEKKSEFVYLKTLSLVGLTANASYVLEDSVASGVVSIPQVKIIKGSPDIAYFDFNPTILLSNRSSRINEGNVELNTLTNIRNIALGTTSAMIELGEIRPYRISLSNFRQNPNQQTTEKNISNFFANFTPGCTFTVSDSEYDFNTNDLNGIYEFINYKFGLLTATVAQGLTNATEQTYSPLLFDTIPVFTLSLSKTIYTDSNKFILTNIIPSRSNSFFSSSIVPNSILEIADRKYKVESLSIKPNKNEELVLIGFDQSVPVTIPTLEMISSNIINVYKQNSDLQTTLLSQTQPTSTTKSQQSMY